MDSQTTFLHLPKTIRIKIYHLSGLVRSCHIDLSSEKERVALLKKRETRMQFDALGQPDRSQPRCRYWCSQRYTGPNPITHKRCWNCVCPPLPLQLLYLSRILYHETVSVLYGRNRIIVTCPKSGMLDHFNILRTLGPHAWANIQFLHLELSALICITNKIPRYEILDRQDSTGNEILTRWTAICAFIAARITPFQLRFSVLCAASDLETAVDIAESMSQLPPLNKCSIQFSDSRGNKVLRSLAKSSSLRFTKRSDERSDVSRSCWKNLPTEIRLQILEETDLVRRITPMNEWTGGGEIKIKNGRLPPSSARRCCQQCTEIPTTCFCSTRNAAFSDTCVCSFLPTAIFQVSRLFNSETTQIFFSMNIFKFSGKFLATTQFLAGLSDAAVQNMRILELHLDIGELFYGLSTPGSRAVREWHDLIALLRDRLLLSKVWLSILAGVNNTAYELAVLNEYDNHDYRWLHTTSFQLLKPLKQLQGLRKFHVSLCWSTDFEAVVEKAVMGPEYDSMAEGKVRPRLSCSYELRKGLRMPMVESLAEKDT